MRAVKLLKKSIPIALKCNGFSMYPLIEKGDIVLIIPARKYFKGEIVAYFVKDQIFVHRIIKTYPKKNNLIYILKGDTQIKSHQIYSGAILGKIKRIYKGEKIILLNKKQFKNYKKFLFFLNISNFLDYLYLSFIKRIILRRELKNKYLINLKNKIKKKQHNFFKNFL